MSVERSNWQCVPWSDTNNDGNVNLSDVLENLKHIVGLKEITSFDLVTENGFAINSLNAESVGNLTLVINGDADQSHADWDLGNANQTANRRKVQKFSCGLKPIRSTLVEATLESSLLCRTLAMGNQKFQFQV